MVNKEEVLGAIIVDYNSAERTVKYIYDLISASDIEVSYIAIVDNSQGLQNSRKIVEEFNLQKFDFEPLDDCIRKYQVDLTYKGFCGNSTIYIIHSAANLGYAKGNNLGFRVLYELHRIPYILVTNNDILFHDNSIRLKFLIDDFIEDDSIGIVGPKVIGIDGFPQSPGVDLTLFQRVWRNYLLGPIPFFRKFAITDLGNVENRGYVYRIIGAFFILRASAFKEIEMFDENTFLYGEELILAERLRAKGYKVFYEPTVTVLHEEGHSTKKFGKVNVNNKVKIRKHLIESSIFYYQKYKGYGLISISISKLICNIHCALYKIKLILHNKLFPCK